VFLNPVLGSFRIRHVLNTVNAGVLYRRSPQFGIFCEDGGHFPDTLFQRLVVKGDCPRRFHYFDRLRLGEIVRLLAGGDVPERSPLPGDRLYRGFVRSIDGEP